MPLERAEHRGQAPAVHNDVVVGPHQSEAVRAARGGPDCGDPQQGGSHQIEAAFDVGPQQARQVLVGLHHAEINASVGQDHLPRLAQTLVDHGGAEHGMLQHQGVERGGDKVQLCL